MERGREGEREKEKHHCVVASHMDLAPNPGMCADCESNQRPFDSQAGAQPTEPHQPGPMIVSYRSLEILRSVAGLRVGVSPTPYLFILGILGSSPAPHLPHPAGSQGSKAARLGGFTCP